MMIWYLAKGQYATKYHLAGESRINQWGIMIWSMCGRRLEEHYIGNPDPPSKKRCKPCRQAITYERLS